MSMAFLKSDSVQSTLRVCVFLITVGIVVNLIALPTLIYVALKASLGLDWIAGYVTALAGLGGAGIVGKVLQKKYEETEKPAE